VNEFIVFYSVFAQFTISLFTFAVFHISIAPMEIFQRKVNGFSHFHSSYGNLPEEGKWRPLWL
jgi:hypothetical protein